MKNDGGPAFPFLNPITVNDAYTAADGMSLRDWFAGQALAGLMVNLDKNSAEAATALAWGMADMMLAEREKSQEFDVKMEAGR